MKICSTLIFLCTSLAFSSCHKDDSCSDAGLMFKANWLLVDQGTDPNNDGNIESHTYNSVPDCIKDDYWIFDCADKLQKVDNTDTCLGRPAVSDIHWHWVNDSIFYIRDDGYFVIKKLTQTQFQFRTSTYNGRLPAGGALLYLFEKR